MKKQKQQMKRLCKVIVAALIGVIVTGIASNVVVNVYSDKLWEDVDCRILSEDEYEWHYGEVVYIDSLFAEIKKYKDYSAPKIISFLSNKEVTFFVTEETIDAPIFEESYWEEKGIWLPDMTPNYDTLAEMVEQSDEPTVIISLADNEIRAIRFYDGVGILAKAEAMLSGGEANNPLKALEEASKAKWTSYREEMIEISEQADAEITAKEKKLGSVIWVVGLVITCGLGFMTWRLSKRRESKSVKENNEDVKK